MAQLAADLEALPLTFKSDLRDAAPFGMLAVPPLDRDESRFAQATAQMLESGDFTVIRFQEEPRFKKPVGIHWLQAASVISTVKSSIFFTSLMPVTADVRFDVGPAARA